MSSCDWPISLWISVWPITSTDHLTGLKLDLSVSMYRLRAVVIGICLSWIFIRPITSTDRLTGLSWELSGLMLFRFDYYCVSFSLNFELY